MKTFRIAVLLLCTAGLAWAQAPEATLKIPSTDVYGGFLVTSPDYGASWDTHLLYGFEGAFSKGLSDRLWITGSVDFSWSNTSIPNSGPSENPALPPGAPVPMHIHQFSGTVGPKFFILTRKLRPYVTGQIGYARQSSHGFYAADRHPTGSLLIGQSETEQGFTYRFGGGAEWHWKPHIYIRLVQWDIQPQPWARHRPFYQNLGAGVGYRF